MNDIKIHDIKELVEIPDFSFYIYSLLWILAIVAFFVLVFLIYKYFSNKKKCKRKEYFKILKELNLNDSKKAAYKITKYARLLSQNEREKRVCSELIEELSPYKYKKEVEPLNDNVKILFGRFMDIIDV